MSRDVIDKRGKTEKSLIAGGFRSNMRTGEDTLCKRPAANKNPFNSSIGPLSALIPGSLQQDSKSLHTVPDTTSDSDNLDDTNVNDIVIPVLDPWRHTPSDRAILTQRLDEDAFRSEIAYLKNELRAHCDKMRFQENVIADTLLYFERGLSRGDWEPVSLIKRRLTKLRGSLEYNALSGHFHSPTCSHCNRSVEEHPCDVNPQKKTCPYHPDIKLELTTKWSCVSCTEQFRNKRKKGKGNDGKGSTKSLVKGE